MTTIAYQLYCSRNAPSVAGTLKMLATTGYKAVEGYGGLFEDVQGLKRGLDETGLTMPSSHIGTDMLIGAPARALRICQDLGIEKAIGPHLQADERPTDADGWRAFGARLMEATAPLRDAGIAVGWHNHDFEFAVLPDGSTPLDHLLAASDALMLELDIGWTVRCGLDPVATIEKYAGRINAAHIKDIAPAGEAMDEDGWADVGDGTLDWPAITAALGRAGCSHFVAEHDNPSDDARFAARSLASITAF